VCTGQCSVPRQAPRRTGCSQEKLRASLLKFTGLSGAPLDYLLCQPNASQRSATRSAVDTWTSPTVSRPHRIVWCATGLVAAMLGFTKQRRESHTVHCPVVHRTIRCSHGLKASRAFQMRLQRLLAALGL
jgi:hypothetical protein